MVARARDAFAGAATSPQDLAAVIALARAGDATARELLEVAGTHLGVVIASVINLMNPAVVVIGGEMAAAGDLVLDPARAAVRSRVLPSSFAATRITASTQGQRASALGAATLVLQEALAQPDLLSR
jgi:predicted NBD/HSP70 family sugar kinase